MNAFSWLYTWPAFVPEVLPGLWTALSLTALSCVLGYILGFFLALMVEVRSKAVNCVALIIVETGRGIPILVLLYIVYQGLPQFQIILDAFPAAVAALTFSAAGYSSEIIRAGLNSVSKGQFEAANSLSFSDSDTYRFIIIPQAARISIPPLVNLTIIIFQATSMAKLITVPEIMQFANIAGASTFKYMSVYVAAAFLYLCITIPGAVLAGFLEKRINNSKSV